MSWLKNFHNELKNARYQISRIENIGNIMSDYGNDTMARKMFEISEDLTAAIDGMETAVSENISDEYQQMNVSIGHILGGLLND